MAIPPLQRIVQTEIKLSNENSKSPKSEARFNVPTLC